MLISLSLQCLPPSQFPAAMSALAAAAVFASAIASASASAIAPVSASAIAPALVLFRSPSSTAIESCPWFRPVWLLSAPNPSGLSNGSLPLIKVLA